MNRRGFLRGALGTATLGFFGWKAALTKVAKDWRRGIAVVVLDDDGRVSLGPELIDDGEVIFENVQFRVRGRYVVALLDGEPVMRRDLMDNGQDFRASGGGGSVCVHWTP